MPDLRVQDKAIRPEVVYLGTTSAAGAANGSTVVDAALANATLAGFVLIIYPFTIGSAAVRFISSIDAVGAVTLVAAFAAQVGAGVDYAIVNLGSQKAAVDSASNITFQDVIGSKDDAAVAIPSNTASIVAMLKGLLNSVGLTLTKGAAGAANYFAGAVAVFTLSPATPVHTSGEKVDLSNFTGGATITCRVYAKVNGSALLLQSTITAVVGTGLGQQQAIPIDNSGDTIDGVASSYQITLQSNNAGDVAVAVGYQYGLS